LSPPSPPPSTASRATATASPQILHNLVGNAVKFTHQGSITVDAALVGADRSRITISVIDTGIGIPADKFDQIFESFTQADSSTTRRFGGTGLGTTIARELVRMMNGDVGVVSTPAKGSTFWFEIPLRLADPDVVPVKVTEDDPYISSTNETAGRHILLAEDSEINALFISTTLTEAGHNVEVVENGELALERLRHDRYDIVFMDMHMPVMDGITATRIWRAEEDRNNSLPIIALTANISEDDRLACLQAGMNEFLSKPVSTERLFSTLEIFTVKPVSSVALPR